jgi:hypothetical protein
MLRYEPQVHERDPPDGEVNAGWTGLFWPRSPRADGLGPTNEGFAPREWLAILGWIEGRNLRAHYARTRGRGDRMNWLANDPT